MCVPILQQWGSRHQCRGSTLVQPTDSVHWHIGESVILMHNDNVVLCHYFLLKGHIPINFIQRTKIYLYICDGSIPGFVRYRSIPEFCSILDTYVVRLIFT